MSSRKSKVLALSLAEIVLMFSGIFSGMVFSRKLSLEDYGTYLQTFLAYDFAVPILTLGLPSALFYFLPRAKNGQKRIILESILLLFITATIFSVFLYFGGTELLAKRLNNPKLSETLQNLVFYPLYTFPILVSSSVWVSYNKVNVNSIYNIVTGLTLTISLIISVFLTQNYYFPIMLRVLFPLITFPLAIYLIFKYVPGPIELPNINSMGKILKFAIPLGMATIIGTLTQQLSNLIVSGLTSPTEFAIYANGAREVPFIGIITGSISVVIMADMAVHIKEKQFGLALELFRKSSIISASYLLPIMIFFMIFAGNFITILFSDKYASSVIPFRIYLLIIPARIAYYGPAFIALGKTQAVLYRTIFELILTAFFVYIFVSLFGIYGAAFGIVATIFFWSLPFNFYHLSKEFNCTMTYIIPFKKIGNILLISLIAGAISSTILLFHLNSFYIFSFGFIVFAFVYSILAFWFVQEFKEITLQYKERLKLMISNNF
jgi:O-antigen/teichoic acid export membrane protein